METETKTGEVLRAGGEDARREAARLLGASRTDRKAASSAANGRQGGRPLKPLAEIACTCGGGEAVLLDSGKPAHKTTCPRGRVIRLRIKKGLPLT